MDTVVDALVGRMLDRWLARYWPGLVFWVAAGLAWVASHGGWSGLTRLTDQMTRQPALVQVLAVTLGLAGIAATIVAVTRLATPVLRLLEGRWVGPLTLPRQWLVARVERRADIAATRLRSLAGRQAAGTLDAAERQRYADLEATLRRLPGLGYCRPTRTGNVLRAVETRVRDKYGLDAVAVWPHLWLLLPEPTQVALATARMALAQAVIVAMWSVAAVTLVGWSWLAAPVGLLLAAAVLRWWVPARAAVYADLLEAAFDLHRLRLYDAVRWPLPATPGAERLSGPRLTTYLVRGLDGDEPRFVEPAPEGSVR